MPFSKNASKIAALAAGLMLAVTSATAASASTTHQASKYPASKSCMAVLQPDGVKSSEVPEPFCVDGDEQALLTALKDERNIVVAEATPEGRAEVQAEQRAAVLNGEIAPMATYVLAKVYNLTNYDAVSGSYLFTTTTGSGCSSHSFTMGDLRNYEWSWGKSLNNSISSVQSASPCKTVLYNDFDALGSSYLVTGNAATLSWMDNLASSIWFTG